MGLLPDNWSGRRARGDRGRLLCLLAAGLLATLALVASSSGAMHSTKLGPRLCETTGGGRFVKIPGFPGERIDRRLLTDVRMLERRYKIFVTDGYSTSEVHAINGEHPVGLALDIVPDTAAGGTWSDIDRLARWAEPRQDEPRSPFRWVGYNGDPNHGRGHHLHLSWSHSVIRPGRTARTVYTLRCPAPGGGTSTPQPEPQPPAGGGTVPGVPSPSGGPNDDENVTAPSSASGGIGSKPRLAPPVPESGGVDG